MEESEYSLKGKGGAFADAPPTFSSWSDEKEETFRVYEERMRAAAKSASRFGLVAGVGIGLLTILIIIAFWSDVDKSMGIHGGPAATAPAPAPGAPAAAPPAAAQPAPAPAATEPAPAATPPAATPPPAAPGAAPPGGAKPAEAPATPK